MKRVPTILKLKSQLKESRKDRKRYLEALCEILGCPTTIVPATVPKAGIEKAKPYQVVITIHCALTRYRRVQAALDNNPKRILRQVEEAADYSEMKALMSLSKSG